MSKIFYCPHCQTQNFATKARLSLVKKIHLKCWKCGGEIKLYRVKKGMAKKRKNT